MDFGINADAIVTADKQVLKEVTATYRTGSYGPIEQCSRPHCAKFAAVITTIATKQITICQYGMCIKRTKVS